jgi:hypothetical protein
MLVEFEATTALMKFTDDVVLQVKAWGDGGSIVNMRSRSRVGSGDWGANYKRMCYIVSKAGLNAQKAPAGMEAREWTAPDAPKAEIDIDAPKRKKSAKITRDVSASSSASSEPKAAAAPEVAGTAKSSTNKPRKAASSSTSSEPKAAETTDVDVSSKSSTKKLQKAASSSTSSEPKAAETPEVAASSKPTKESRKSTASSVSSSSSSSSVEQPPQRDEEPLCED